jgi:hypothetical protein
MRAFQELQPNLSTALGVLSWTAGWSLPNSSISKYYGRCRCRAPRYVGSSRRITGG